MRDLASCFNEYSVNVSSDTSCSNYSNKSSFISPNSTPSIQNTVTCLYKSVLSSNKQIMHFTLTWHKNSLSQGLSITLNDDPSTAFKLNTNTNTRLFRKLKGSKYMDFQTSKLEIFYDLSTAKHETGPEPVTGYYILVTVDTEIALVIGDMAKECSMIRKVKPGTKTSIFSLITRKEHFSGNAALYSTKARFCEAGSSHDISIRCSDEKDGLKYPITLSVTIDKKMVMRVKRLQWNFRGNQTIFLDGLLVDLMWDVHDWFYNPGSANAVFLFRTRSGLESRLWLEEKLVKKDHEERVDEFSFLIYACKNL